MTTELDDKTLAETQTIPRPTSAARAEKVEHQRDAAVAVIRKMAAYIRIRAGHEEHCRGWRRPLKDKGAPARQQRGEWMDIRRCTCGPGDLLKLAAEVAP